MDKLKLNFEILPSGAWNFNLRTQMSKKAWDVIRKDAYKNANDKCSICNRSVKKLHAHERWSFDSKTHVQKLKEVIAVCPLCHMVIHIGRTQLLGKEDLAISHFKRVNDVDFSAYTKALSIANKENIELSKIDDWSLDLSYLKKFIED